MAQMAQMTQSAGMTVVSFLSVSKWMAPFASLLKEVTLATSTPVSSLWGPVKRTGDTPSMKFIPSSMASVCSHVWEGTSSPDSISAHLAPYTFSIYVLYWIFKE